MGRAFGTNGGGRAVHRVLVGKPEGKNLLGEPGADRRIILNGSSGSGMGLWGLDGAGSG
jgi:hypothetical protein